MSTSVSHFFETDVDICNTKNNKKITKRMSTPVSHFFEMNDDIQNGKNRTKIIKTNVDIRFTNQNIRYIT